jgi:predicted nucleic acid-binding protein
MSKIFIDTNILVYGFDGADKQKQKAARQALKKSQESGSGVISTQVLQEFYVTATKKLGMDPLVAKDLLDSFDVFEIVVVSPSLIASAVDCQVLAKLSFWDALIVAAAEASKCETLWSEDFQRGRVLRGMRIDNPLLA